MNNDKMWLPNVITKIVDCLEKDKGYDSEVHVLNEIKNIIVEDYDENLIDENIEVVLAKETNELLEFISWSNRRALYPYVCMLKDRIVELYTIEDWEE